ncbi:hypothetical protein [Pandoraea pulmonicola]|uniref:Uncharacterized protein n=1 Tax=Pandoraea pulmonicola TaxID=93221 RepID=A0AAJ5D393_PANPU|nr:hypothetical protein [Pandoraea pulmonicola]AJC22355.1 hypothetical protein RO07_21065 [Pandoraea pulmonicola]SUD95591.1 Uncharacterised protein [Pandoraea pulmonicola]
MGTSAIVSQAPMALATPPYGQERQSNLVGVNFVGNAAQGLPVAGTSGMSGGLGQALADDVAMAIPCTTCGVIGEEVAHVQSATHSDAQVHETCFAGAPGDRYKKAEERNARAYLECLLDEADRVAFAALQFTSLDRDELDNVATVLHKLSLAEEANADGRELQKIADVFSGFVRSAASVKRTDGSDVTRDGETIRKKFGEFQKLTLRLWEKHALSAQTASEAYTRRATHEGVSECLGGSLVGDVYDLKDRHAAQAQQRMKAHAFESAVAAGSPGVKLRMIATALHQEDASPELLRNVRGRNGADGTGVSADPPSVDGASPATATPGRHVPDFESEQTLEADQSQDARPVENEGPGASLSAASEESERIADNPEGSRRADMSEVHSGTPRSSRARSMVAPSVVVNGGGAEAIKASDVEPKAQPVGVPVADYQTPGGWQRGTDGKWTRGGKSVIVRTTDGFSRIDPLARVYDTLLERIEAKKNAHLIADQAPRIGKRKPMFAEVSPARHPVTSEATARHGRSDAIEEARS